MELYDKTFMINKEELSNLDEFDDMLVEIPIDSERFPTEIDSELTAIIWRLRQLKDPTIKRSDSNKRIKDIDTVMYMMLYNGMLKEKLYICSSGRMWSNIPAFRKHLKKRNVKIKIIPLEKFGKFVEVPSIDGLKQALNVINMLGHDNILEIVDQHVLDKLANINGDSLSSMSRTVLRLREKARRTLNARGYNKFRVKPQEV